LPIELKKLTEPQKIRESSFIEILLRDKKSVIIDADCKKWYYGGRLHREDGPAVENSDGSGEWWINGGFVGLTFKKILIE
jgi:hypothetical protein